MTISEDKKVDRPLNEEVHLQAFLQWQSGTASSLFLMLQQSVCRSHDSSYLDLLARPQDTSTPSLRATTHSQPRMNNPPFSTCVPWPHTWTCRLSAPQVLCKPSQAKQNHIICKKCRCNPEAGDHSLQACHRSAVNVHACYLLQSSPNIDQTMVAMCRYCI